MLRIRLRRDGGRSKPFYRIVVSDSRLRPSAEFVEMLGYYDPKTNPATVKFDRERAKYWIGQGATASETVASLLARD
jgi:small subunit ribosomal protein S16